MSMTGHFLLVSDADVAHLLAAPRTILPLLTSRVYDVEHPDGYVDVDKAWHCLHFLLTGTAWEGPPPLDFIATGGVSIGDEDVGYGPARALESGVVAALSDALDRLPPEVLVARYDAPRMASLKIYPSGWTEVDPTPDFFGYFMGAYEELRALVRRGAQERRALLIWLS
jgi:hypothetical protein